MMDNIAIKFEKEKIEKMLDMQEKLDNYIIEKHNIGEDTNLLENKFIALKVELNEFMNEIESFKHWKVNKGKDNILEEAIDTIHFILSIMNDFKMRAEKDIVITKDELEESSHLSLNQLYIMTDTLMTDAYMMKAWEEQISSITIGIILMLNRCNFSTDDIYNEYIRKNEINIERQNNNY